MKSRQARRILSVLAVLPVVGLMVARKPAAASPDVGTKVTFGFSGTFAATPISGTDPLNVAGQFFFMNVVAYTSLVPVQHGQNWAVFTPLTMTGGLGQYALNSTTAGVVQTVGDSEDIFQTGTTATVSGESVTVRAYITLPGGTLPNPRINPFASVAAGPGTTVTYSDGVSSTVLAVQDGTTLVGHARTR